MAVATSSSPNTGFSYAQAAKGRPSNMPSQTPGKVASDPSASAVPEAGSSRNWAEDSETSTEHKTERSHDASQEQANLASVKDSAVERTKEESKVVNGVSGGSSPNLSASGITEKTDESATINGNGLTTETTTPLTWETKSQGSEGTWIADREKRQQSASRNNDTASKSNNGKGGKGQPKEGKEPALPQTVQPPPILYEAPAPAVNPWLKRAEDAKAKSITKPAVTEISNNLQSSNTDDSRRANGPIDANRDLQSNSENRRPHEGKRSSDARPYARQGPRPSENVRPDASAGRPAQREHRSLPNLVASVPLSVAKDESAWPTPDLAQKEERKEASPTKEAKDGEGNDGEENPSGKPRAPTKWTTLPVVPTIKWNTEEMNRPRGEKSGRGGPGTRGRGGGYRGTSNGYKGGDRAVPRTQGFKDDNDDHAGDSSRNLAETASMPPPPKPAQAAGRSQSLEHRGPSYRHSDAKTAYNAYSNDVNSSDATHTGAPNSTVPMSNGALDAKAAETIPASNAVAEDGREHSSNGDAVFRKTPSEFRKTADGHKDWSNGAPRGSKRNGRGRGGSREFANGHQASQAYGHGSVDYSAGSYSIPPSPGAYQSPRGGQFGFQHHGRGGWRGNPRSQSIPIEGSYGAGRYPYGHMAPVPPPLQPMYYPMMDPAYSAVPMAVGYNPGMDYYVVVEALVAQINFYFGHENMIKDHFLRQNMDSKGYVLLDTIANFNRVKTMSTDREVIKAACLRSQEIDIRVGEDGKERLRKRVEWEKHILPMDQRLPVAQNEGPETVMQLEQPAMQQLWTAFDPGMLYRSPSSAGPNGAQQRQPFDGQYPMNGMIPFATPTSPFPPTQSQFGEDSEEAARGRSAKSPIREYSPGQHFSFNETKTLEEPDAFPDDKIAELNVIYRRASSSCRVAHHNPSARSFSSGSVDSRNIVSEVEKLSERLEPPATNGDAVSHTNGDTEGQDISDLANTIVKRMDDIAFLWVKDQQVNLDQIPGGTHLMSYNALRAEAFLQRTNAPHGTCPSDMDTLYMFWSHFLIRNFNKKMYSEFRASAHEDAKHRGNVDGLMILVNFYAESLMSSSHIIRDSTVADYVDLVKNQPASMHNYAFTQLRRVWRDGSFNLKNRKKLTTVLDQTLLSQVEA